MAHLRLVEPTIDTYGSRRAWKRHQRETRHQQSARASGGDEDRGPSLPAVALASVAILTVVVLLVLLLSQVASAFVG
jgi:hypothetical protein